MAKKEQAGGKKHGYPWWLETLAAIGVAATLTVIITLFFSEGRRPARLTLTQAPAVDDPAFLASVAGTAGAPVRMGGTVHLLNNGVVKVTGPPAATLQSAFVQLWAYASGELLAGPTFFPPESIESAPGSMRHTGVASAPSREEYPLRLFFIESFGAARQRLYITTPYFVPDEGTRRVAEDRARAGVDVRVLLPDEHTDARPIRLAGHRYYEEMLETGIRVYEYRATMIHTKSVVVDGKWSIVGSANMDIRSKELNMENVLGILDGGFAGELEAAFRKDLEKSKEIKLEEWRRRGLVHRVLERVCALFAEQY